MGRTLRACFAVVLAVLLLAAGPACGGDGENISAGLINILVAPASSSISIGATQQFTASGVYSDGTNQDITSSVTWTSSSTAVATISAAGLAASVAAGSTTIQATAGSISGSATLTVTPPVSAGRIAFVSNRDGARHLYVVNSDGTSERRVTSLTGGVSDVDWSPNGSQFVFYSLMDAEIFLVNSDGSGERQLTMEEPGDASTWPSWSPDGSRIAFVSDRTGSAQVFIMNADGTNQTRLTYAASPYTSSTFSFTTPGWSPNGNLAVCETHWSISGGGTEDAGGLYVFSISGGTYSKLTNNADDHDAAWSPDGARIAFWRTNSSNADGGDIYVMNSDGSSQTKLAQGVNPSWSPDGARIAFVSDRDGNGGRLWVISPDGSGEKNLIPADLGIVPVAGWTPSWSPDGKQLLFENDGVIYAVNADGSGLIRITTVSAQADTGPLWSPA